MIEKRYQVFVSSTFEDLKEERAEVVKGLLALNCIPCGMEYFPAANTDSWSHIERLIKQCDYYIVIIAGKYGSLCDDGISYTQKEFQCAVDNGVPVLAFVNEEYDNLSVQKLEADVQQLEKLREFTSLVKKRLCNFWTNKDQLRADVVTSLHHLIQNEPRPGWIRADALSLNADLMQRAAQFASSFSKNNSILADNGQAGVLGFRDFVREDASASDVEIRLQAYNRAGTGAPMLSFDVETDNVFIRNAFRTVLVCLSLRNNSADSIKDIKCELIAESEVKMVLSDKMFVENDTSPTLHWQHVIDPKTTEDVQLRPRENCEHFATFFVRPEGSGNVNWKITVLNSIRPVHATATTRVQIVKIPLRTRAAHLIESVWDQAKNHAEMLSCLIGAARAAASVENVDWEKVFSDYIEGQWHNMYGV